MKKGDFDQVRKQWNGMISKRTTRKTW